MAFQSVKGFKDILPPESGRTTALETTARRVLGLYGYREIRLPALEPKELFVKSTGETTDIVEKEMFELEDAGGRRLALRPEGTPGAVRAFLQHSLAQGGLHKLYYVGSMYRAERPQAGRFREFEQIGAEYFGNPHPAADAEIIGALAHILDAFGLAGRYSVHVNNLGCENKDCRPAFREKLRSFLQSIKTELCENCRRRIDRNPLRALDCKGDGPRIKDRAPNLTPCGDCLRHFERTKSLLAIPIQEDPSLVRGLDYYTRTVFEFKSSALGSQDALAGGGRYDNLVKSMGGPETPAVGWALGVERTLMAGPAPSEPAPTSVFVAVQSRNESLESRAFTLLSRLRHEGVSATGGAFDRSLKSQMREASDASYAVIFGEQEAAEGKCIVKDLKEGSQESMPDAEALAYLKTRLEARR